ncbi:MAG: heparinase II/III family protein, partial [Bacteroidales bacterium]|nr:heparinase II/III family protein [Bacteroidales bacterium]
YNGHYTHENESWAKSSIAHNTLVVDGQNMFGGKWRESQKYHPEVLWYSFEDDLQSVAAREDNAYPGVSFTRYLVYATVPFLEYPLIMDVLKAESSSRHQYDYPVHYNGHMISLSVPYERALTSMSTLGNANGYQHIWTEAKGRGAQGTTSYTWLTGYRMYTVSTATTPSTEVYICRGGASDPDFNLRNEPMYILREKNAGDHVFASCIETHGKYDLQVEQSANLVHSCKGVTVLSDDADGISVRYDFIGSHSVTLTVSPTQTATVKYN